MCMTASPAQLSDTRIYAAEVMRENQLVHVLGYQNAISDSKGPNCMLLPIPSAEPMTEANLVNDRGAARGLKVLCDWVRPQAAMRTLGRSWKLGKGPALVFSSGSYTVVLATSPWSMFEALARVPDNQRPNIGSELMFALDRRYPDHHFALCCFDADRPVAPEPLFWWYVPQDPSNLFAPALDAHDGGPPVAGMVKRDHTLVFGSSLREAHGFNRALAASIDNQVPAHLRWMFTSRVDGDAITGGTQNGDFVYRVDVLRERGGDSGFAPRLKLDAFSVRV